MFCMITLIIIIIIIINIIDVALCSMKHNDVVWNNNK
jgi:hypothetical protein